MTPDEMHAAAAKLREAQRDAPDLDTARYLCDVARFLDRLAVSPARDPIDALFAPRERQTLTVRCTPNEDGTVTGEVVRVRETPKEG